MRDSRESRGSVRKNMKLFFQTVIQDVLFFIDNLFTFILLYGITSC